MSHSSLADLDELVLLCRDDRPRTYIAEAVACYRAGAIRAAIVATWIAVCYDIIDKLRELALAGDKEAEKLSGDIEKARRTNDLLRSLALERELLVAARDRFDLISHLEYLDLERLQQDRNRCAHPSLATEEQVFQAPGELARLHIRNAVIHLLQHPPAQGKYALERLIREVDSQYFPSALPAAVTSLSSGPLRRPRPSLVRNFVVVLLKRLLDPSTPILTRRRLFAAVGATRRLQLVPFEAVLAEKLSDLVRSLSDAALPVALEVLVEIEDSWQFLAADVRNRLERLVRNLPTGSLDALERLLEFTPLREASEHRVKNLTREDIRSTSFFTLPPSIADRCIDLYLLSGTFAEANEWASEVGRHAIDFSADQQRRLLTEAATRTDVRSSFQLPTVVARLRQTNKLPHAEFVALARALGIDLAEPPPPAEP